MQNILKQPYTNEQYAGLAAYANQTQRRIEIIDDTAYALLESEVVQDGKIVDISGIGEYRVQILEKAKALKLQENEQKRNVEFIQTSLGKLKTQTPLGDLKTALPLYEKLAEANNGLPAGAVRLYDDNGNPSPSPEMGLEQFRAVMLEIAMAYIGIDAKSTAITKAVQGAKSLEEVEGVGIGY